MVAWLQEPQVSVDKEEEDAGENHAQVGNADVQYVEDDEENVEMVSVEEHFKRFSPNPIQARYPNHYGKHYSNHSC